MTLSDLPGAFSRALAQLPSRRFLGILALSLALVLVVTGPFLLFLVSIAWLIDIIPTPAFLSTGADGGSWVGWTSWNFWTYVMSPLVLAVVSLLLDRIVDAVEARYYPDLSKVRRRGMVEAVLYATRFLGLMLAVSAAAGLVAWLTPFPGWLVFTAATGYLVAREYYETVALRRVTEADAKREASRNLLPLWAAGIVVALALNVPLLNLIAPIIGVAAFTHLYHAQHRSRT